MVRLPMLAALTAAFSLVAVGCDDPKSSPGAPSATSQASSAPSVAAVAPKPKTMPELVVDADGPYLGGSRIDLGASGGREKLKKIVSELPIDGKPVTLQAERKAKTPEVAAVVAELGAAGAPKIVIKTDGRGDLPKEITVTPEARVSSPPGCSVVTTVMKDDLSTAVWPFKGGVGKRQRKGLAGPDLSHTGETLEKDLAGCSSTMAFFSAEGTLPWEMAFNLAGTVLVSDLKKNIDTLVLLHEAPVAGRPVNESK